MKTRFSEKTQTYEFIVMFTQMVEKTDESVIDLQPGDIVDQKERRRYLREELRFHHGIDNNKH